MKVIRGLVAARNSAMHWQFLYGLILFLLWMPYTYAIAVNVYLKADNSALKQNIYGLNHYLEKEHFLQKYRIAPFIDNHPLHVTLYLAQYPKSALSQLLARTQRIAKKMAPISAVALNFKLTPSHYLMVDIGLTAMLQQASDTCVAHLSPLRDVAVSIPEWAAKIPSKKAVFLKYGSPNVYSEFAPHLSVLTKKITDAQAEEIFTQELLTLLEHYRSSFPIQFSMDTLAVGIVDEWGQITEELAAYSLTLLPVRQERRTYQ